VIASRWLFILVAALSFNALAQSAAPNANLKSAPPEAAAAQPRVLIGVPYNVFSKLDQGRPVGIMLETLDALVQQMGFQPSYISIPPSDMVAALESGQIDIASVRIQSARSKEKSHFSSPIVTEFNIPITRAGSDLKIRSIADLQGKSIAGRIGFHYPALENVPNLKLERYDSDAAMVRALLLKKVDIAIIAGLSDIFMFRTEGVLRQVEISDAAIGSVPLRVAFSAKRFSAEQVVDFNKRLAEFQQGDDWQGVLDRNGFADLVKDWPSLQ
jgi:ABC-type amino acid transport substrate-binding protein